MAAAADPYHYMATFDLNLSTLTSQSYRTLMEQKHNHNLELATHTFRGVPITTVLGTFHRIRLYQEGADSIHLIFRNSDRYFVGFQHGLQVFHFKDTSVPHVPGLEFTELETMATHGALSQGKKTTVGGIVMIQAYYDLVGYRPGNPLTNAVMKALHRCTLMFSEAERFRSGQDHVCLMIDGQTCKVMPVKTSKRFTCWGSLSKVGLRARQREEDENQVPDENVPAIATKLHINSMQELVGEHGELLLLLYCPGYGI